MSAKRKITAIEFFDSLKLAYNVFKLRTKYSPVLYISVVSSLMIVRGYLNFYEKELRVLLDGRNKMLGIEPAECTIGVGEMVIFIILKLLWWIIDFITKMAFEVLITPVGGILARHMMKQMLLTDDVDVFGIVPAHCEYTITESSKAVAKIIRLLFINLTDAVIQLFSDFGYIYSYDRSAYKQTSVVFMSLMLVVTFIKIYHLHTIFQINNRISEANSEKEKNYVETLDAIAVVKAYGEEEKMIRRYRKSLYKWEGLTAMCKTLQFSNDLIFNIFCQIVVAAGTILYISNTEEKTGVEFIKGKEEVDSFHKVLNYIPSCFSNVMKFYTSLAESVVLSQRLTEYMKYEAEETSKKIRIRELKHAIEVQNLTYINKDKIIFSDVSFTLNRGDKAALFGRNGTGKSSIFRLLLGFDTYHGSILVDGLELSRVAMDDYRKLVTYVPQDTRLFDESIFYNLSYGNDKTFREVVDECKKIGIHDTVMGFPEGYNTPVGEGGKNINGGLRQKIFYARAFLCDSEVYLFDEPTNNLDVGHSKFLLQYVNDAKYATKTFMVICHDREIVSEFPKILQFEDGRIHEVASL